MEAAGQNGIPTCFIVGKSGLIEWIGHPMRMDAPLEQIIAGTWDREKAAAEIKEQQRIEAAMGKVARAMQQGKHEEALTGIDEIIASMDDSNEMKSALKGFRMQILLEAERYDDVAKALNELVAVKPIDSQTLNMHAWTIYEMAVADKDLNKDLVKAALKAAEKAVEGAPEDGMILDTLAHLLHHFGELDRAIEVQEKAVKNPGPAKEDIIAFLEALKAEKADK
jgi:tetratricopeptide (TPR) repeat protein